MLSNEEELELQQMKEGIENEGLDILILSKMQWLIDKCSELNKELKLLLADKCTGEERHRHFSLDTRRYVTHIHSHSQRITTDFNTLHHHPPMEHRVDERNRARNSESGKTSIDE